MLKSSWLKPKENVGLCGQNSAKEHRTTWLVATRRYRCSKIMKMPGKCEDGHGIQLQAEKMGERRFLGGHDLVRRVEPTGEALVWCRNGSGSASAVGDRRSG